MINKPANNGSQLMCPSLPELNGVANALLEIEFALDVVEHEEAYYALVEAQSQLKNYAAYVRTFEKTPMFWHTFKALKGVL